MPPRAKKISEEAFSRHHEYIKEMYLSRSLSLDEICAQLEARGLVVTQAQLRYQLKKWQLRRNTKGSDWRLIGHLVDRRRQKGKESGVFLGQFYYSPSKVAKEVSRNCPASLVAKYRREPTPPYPNDLPLRICTPQPVIVDITWPQTLPWLQFQDQYAESLYRSLPALGFPNGLNGMFDRIVLPCDLLKLDVFQSIRPRSFVHNEIHCSSLLSQRLQVDHSRQAFDVLLFMLANHLDELFPHDLKSDWNQNFQFFSNFLEEIGLTKIEVNIDSIADATLAATLERLSKIVVSGIDDGRLDPTLHPQTMDCFSWILRSAVEESVKSIGELLSEASVPSAMCIKVPDRLSDHQSPISKWPKFLEHDLACHGKTNNTVALQLVDSLPDGKGVVVLLAALTSNPPSLTLAKYLLESRPFLSEKSLQNQDGSAPDIVLTLTPQICAACLDDELQAKRMIQLVTSALQVRNSSMARQNKVDTLTMACLKGHDDLVEILIASIVGFDIEECNSRGLSPLQAAAAGGRLSTCEKLLAMGALLGSPKSPQLCPLLWAVHNGHVDVAKLLVGQGARLFAAGGTHGHRHNDTQRSIDKALYVAIRNQDSDLLALVLKLGADANSDAYGPRRARPLQECLQLASQRQFEGKEFLEIATNMAQKLLEEGATVNCGDTTQAAKMGAPELVKLLQEHDGLGVGEDKNEPAGLCLLEHALLHEEDDKVFDLITTSLPTYNSKLLCAATSRACTNRDSKILDMLLQKRTSTTLGCDEFEATAIGIAVAHGKSELFHFLMAHFQPPFSHCKAYIPTFPHQCSICRGGRRRLTCRCQWATPREFTFWQPHRRSEDPFDLASPLAAAVVSETPEASTAMMRDYGFDIDRFTVATAALLGLHDLSRELLENCTTWHTDRCRWSKNGRDIMRLVVRNQDKAIMQMLLSSGEDLKDRGYRRREYGRSPLQRAAEVGSMAMIEMLLAAGADVNSKAARRGGATALQLASINGYMDIAKLLIDRDANVNAPGASRKGGRTALQGASEYGRIDMAAYLLSLGAETTGRYRYSFIKAVALARKEGHHVLETMLKKRCGWSRDDENYQQRLVSGPGWTSDSTDGLESSDEDSDEDNDEDIENGDKGSEEGSQLEGSQLEGGGRLRSSNGTLCSDLGPEEFGPANIADTVGSLSDWLQAEGVIGTARSPWYPEFEPYTGDLSHWFDPADMFTHAEHRTGVQQGVDPFDGDG